MISVLFKAWINKISKWCFHCTCAHCMLLMLASVYCRIKNSLSKHHHPCTVCHKLDKFQTLFLHQRLIGDSSLCWWIDGIQEQVKSKEILLEISHWCKLLRWSCRFFLGLIYVALHQVNCGIRKCSTTFSLSQWSHSLV